MPGREVLAAGAAETAAVAVAMAGAITGGFGVKTAVAEDNSRKNDLDLC